MRALRGLVLFGTWASAGCRPPVPEQAVNRPPTPRAAALASPAARDSWIFRPSTRQLDYVIDHVAALRTGDDTAQRSDSVSSHTEVRFTLASPGPRISGFLLAYHVQLPGTAAAVPAGMAFPFPFLVSYSGADHQLRVLVPGAAPCAAPAVNMFHALRDLWFLAPDTLRLGTQWQDSATYTSCRDGIPFGTVLRRAFRVAGSQTLNGRTVVRLVRLARSEISGEGVQGREQVSLAGSAQGELVYLLDVDAGEVVSAEGSAALDLRLRSKVRLQSLRQTSTIRLSRRP